MGDLRVGSLVSNPDGSVAKVIQVHPQGEQDVYEVSFSDGAKTRVTAEHLWLVRLANKRIKAKRTHDNGEEIAGRLADTAWLKGYIDQQKTAKRPYWPLIPLTQPVEFTAAPGRWGDPITVDPYVLGVLLGDGCLRSGGITLASADDEIVDEMRRLSGCEIAAVSKHQWRFRAPGDLRKRLEKLDVYGHLAATKAIPKVYKRSSIAVRTALLQGLMDTDGFVDARGHCQFYSVSKQLAEDVQWVARSLGAKATITTKDGNYVNDEGVRVPCQLCYCVYIQSSHNRDFFRLTRKRDRCTDSFNGGFSVLQRRMIDIQLVGREECRCITVDHPNGLYLTDDFIVTHNSFALLAAAAMYVEIPNYNALLLRRTFADLSLPDALMDIAFQWWKNSAAKWDSQNHTWTFPSGARIVFGYMETEKDVYRYQGMAAQFVGYDELTQFSRFQYTYLFSRMRRRISFGAPLRMRSASNPGGEGHEWVRQRFLTEGAAKGRIFIPAGLADNPYIDAEEYAEGLEELDPLTRAQLLDGNWEATEEGIKFRREWFGTIVNLAPLHARRARAWDLAATEKSKRNKDPDFTVGTRMCRTAQGMYYLEDQVAAQATALAVEQLVRLTAEIDGIAVPVLIEQEPGAAGKSLISHYQRNVLPEFAVYGVRSTGSKITRAEPMSANAQANNIGLVRGPWIGDWLNEACIFPFGPHDDRVDSASLAFAWLAQKRQQSYAVGGERTVLTMYTPR